MRHRCVHDGAAQIAGPLRQRPLGETLMKSSTPTDNAPAPVDFDVVLAAELMQIDGRRAEPKRPLS